MPVSRSTTVVAAKECSQCRQEKPLTEFHLRKSKSGKLSRYASCKKCSYARSLKWSESNKDKQRVALLKYKQSEKGKAAEKRAYERRLPKVAELNRLYRLKVLGVSKEEYEARFAAQGGLCAICDKPESRKSKYGKVSALILDHNHETGDPRGLICHGCNAALGFSRECIETLQNMVAYVKKWNK